MAWAGGPGYSGNADGSPGFPAGLHLVGGNGPTPPDVARGVCDPTRTEDRGSIVVDPRGSPPGGDLTLEQAFALLPSTGQRTIYLRTGLYRVRAPLILAAAVDGLAMVACPGEIPVLMPTGLGPTIVLRGVRRVALVGLVFAGPAPSHVVLEDARDCLIEHSTFLDAGTAIVLDHASGNRIRGNLIARSASTGIELRNGSDSNLVDDNIVDGADGPETHGGGIFLHGVRDDTVAHNLIQNVTGFGIGVANWDDASVNIANVVEYNVLRATTLTAEDSGAIYVLGRSGADTQIVIAGNVIDGVGASGRHDVGIYLDDSTNGAIVTRNLVRHVGSDAVQIHGGSDNLVTNNILDLGDGRPSAVLFQAAPADTHPLNVQTGNTVVTNIIISSNDKPKIYYWIDGGQPLVAGNLYALSTGKVPLSAGPVDDSAPVFVDRSFGSGGISDNYAAVQAAAVAAIGFKPIDPSLAGPRPFQPDSFWRE